MARAAAMISRRGRLGSSSVMSEVTVSQPAPVQVAYLGFPGTTGADFFDYVICDKITAYTACQAVTSALYVREKTGAGQHIDLSMLDAGLFFIFPDGFQNHTLLDENIRLERPMADMYQITRTRDGGGLVGCWRGVP